MPIKSTSNSPHPMGQAARLGPDAALIVRQSRSACHRGKCPAFVHPPGARHDGHATTARDSNCRHTHSEMRANVRRHPLLVPRARQHAPSALSTPAPEEPSYVPDEWGHRARRREGRLSRALRLGRQPGPNTRSRYHQWRRKWHRDQTSTQTFQGLFEWSDMHYIPSETWRSARRV